VAGELGRRGSCSRVEPLHVAVPDEGGRPRWIAVHRQHPDPLKIVEAWVHVKELMRADALVHEVDEMEFHPVLVREVIDADAQRLPVIFGL
jgi:hypothetical protein